MHPSGREAAYATFCNFHHQDGPDEIPVTAAPTFPDEKKQKYCTRREQQELLKQQSKSRASDVCLNHNWVPHFTRDTVSVVVWGLGFGVWGLGFGVWGLGFGVWGLGFVSHFLSGLL
jgi:hypothetical protein